MKYWLNKLKLNQTFTTMSTFYKAGMWHLQTPLHLNSPSIKQMSKKRAASQSSWQALVMLVTWPTTVFLVGSVATLVITIAAAPLVDTDAIVTLELIPQTRGETWRCDTTQQHWDDNVYVTWHAVMHTTAFSSKTSLGIYLSQCMAGVEIVVVR